MTFGSTRAISFLSTTRTALLSLSMVRTTGRPIRSQATFFVLFLSGTVLQRASGKFLLTASLATNHLKQRGMHNTGLWDSHRVRTDLFIWKRSTGSDGGKKETCPYPHPRSG
jgi:hypothetical protein